MPALCATCGNDIPEYCGGRCPFCGKALPVAVAACGSSVRRVNIKEDKPDVATALTRFSGALERAQMDGVAVLVVIHGYGASGSGGAIRDALRRQLDVFREEGKMKRRIFGEDFSKNDNTIRALVRRYPSTVWDRSMEGNPGLTIVVL